MQEQLIKELECGLSTFRIEESCFQVQDDKGIFDLTKLAPKLEKTPQCYSCHEFEFKKDKHRFWCQFCGNNVCE
jgi:hypothetical protein